MASNYVNSPELSDFSQEPRAAGFGTASKHGTASEGSSNVQARVSFVFWCLWVPNWKNIHIMPTCLYVLSYTHYPPWLTLGWQRVSKNTYAQAHTHMYVYTHSPWQPFRHVSITPRDFFRQWSLSRAGTVVCLCVPSMRRSLSCLRVTVRSMRSEANRFSSWKKGKRLFLSARRTVSALLYVFSSFKVVWRSRCRFSWSTTIFIGCLQVSSLTSPLPGRAWTLLGMAFWSGRWIPNAHPQSRWSEGVRCGSTFDLRSCFRTTSASTGFWFSHHRSRIWKNNDTYIYIYNYIFMCVCMWYADIQTYIYILHGLSYTMFLCKLKCHS